MQWRSITLAETDSTNSHAKRLLASGDITSSTLIRAETQSAGRGRLDRAWVSPAGNLHMTLAHELRTEHPQAQLVFIAALAVTDVIPLSLKWPNDLLCHGKKCGGILVETVQSQPYHVVTGIGLNLMHAPDAEGMLYPATSLQAEGMPTAEPDVLAAQIANNYSMWVRRWQQEGFAPVREAWLARAAKPATEVTVNTPTGAVKGSFSTIDDTGALMLKTAQGIQRITVGDVGI